MALFVAPQARLSCACSTFVNSTGSPVSKAATGIDSEAASTSAVNHVVRNLHSRDANIARKTAPQWTLLLFILCFAVMSPALPSAQKFASLPALGFSKTFGGDDPLSQRFTVASTGISFPFSAAATTTTGGAWLTITPNSFGCCGATNALRNNRQRQSGSHACRGNLHRANCPDRAIRPHTAPHHSGHAGDSCRHSILLRSNRRRFDV